MDNVPSVSTVSVKLPKTNRSNRACCVSGCTNSERKNPDLHFYRFPGYQWEEYKKQAWIEAVRRHSPDRKLWVPTKNSRICSAHFVGGERSNNPKKESYHPTLFPTNKKTKLPVCTGAERFQAPGVKIEQIDFDPLLIKSEAGNSEACEFSDSVCYSDNAPEKSEIGIQTDPDFDTTSQENTSSLCSWTNGIEAWTQTLIVVRYPFRNQEPVRLLGKWTISKPVTTRTIPVGADYRVRAPFMGYTSIETDQVMKEFGGVNLHFFNVLLKFVSPKNNGQPSYFKKLSAENRLLLFLMKMKHGLNFAVLGILFNISSCTAASVFETVLKTLVSNTKPWLSWPSRELIKETTSARFAKYPNCRAIIDCLELRCDTPPNEKQRKLMYSPDKSSYTLKCLIAISPAGLVTFCSKGHGGQSTDDFIANDSGFLSLVEPGDEILALKDFPEIKTELLNRKCTLVMIPFTREEILEGYSKVSLRTHVEKAMQRIRMFKILNHVNAQSISLFDDIISMACILANNNDTFAKK